VNYKEKVKMAIWMYNKLIERYPNIYTALKEQYLKEKE